MFATIAFSFLAQVATAKTITSLSDLSWTVSNAELGISVPALYPSHVHLALHDALVIDNPYHGLNEFDQRWVAQHNWTYSAALTGLYVLDPLNREGILSKIFSACLGLALEDIQDAQMTNNTSRS